MGGSKMNTGMFFAKKKSLTNCIGSNITEHPKYRFVESNINFLKVDSLSFDKTEVAHKVRDLTKAQWKQYYKKLGLE